MVFRFVRLNKLGLIDVAGHHLIDLSQAPTCFQIHNTEHGPVDVKNVAVTAIITLDQLVYEEAQTFPRVETLIHPLILPILAILWEIVNKGSQCLWRRFEFLL